MSSPDLRSESDPDQAVRRIEAAVAPLAVDSTGSRPLIESVQLLEELHNELQSALTDLDPS